MNSSNRSVPCSYSVFSGQVPLNYSHKCTVPATITAVDKPAATNVEIPPEVKSARAEPMTPERNAHTTCFLLRK